MQNDTLRIIGKDKVARNISAQSIIVHQNRIEAALDEDIFPLTENRCLYVKEESGWKIRLVNRISSVADVATSFPYKFLLFARGAGDDFLTKEEIARIDESGQG